MRTCSTCGGPFTPKVHTQRFCTSSCRDHKLGRRAKQRTTARGYGYAHQQERERWRPLVDAGQVACWRCQQPIIPGTVWHLGHDDHDRRIYRGPEHEACNLRAAAAKGNRAGKRYTSSTPRIAR